MPNKVLEGVKKMYSYLAKHTETEEHMLVMTVNGLTSVAVIKDTSFRSLINASPVPLPNGNYVEHYKGNLYFIIDIARDITTLENYVVYGDLKGNIWVRPKKMFFEHVEYNGERVPRFKRIDYK